VIDSSIGTLFLTKYSPYPPMGGSPLRNWQNINLMMKLGPVAVFSIVSYKSPRSREYPPGVAIWKDYNTGDILKARSIWRKIKDRLWWLQPYAYPEADPFYADSLVQELDQLLAKFQPQIVVFAELWLYRYLRTVQKHQCRIIYDAHNIETLLLRERYRSVEGVKSKIESRLLLTKVEAIERDFVRQVDQIWVCSQDDVCQLKKLYNPQVRPTHLINNGVNIAYYESVRLGECNLPTELELIPWTLVFTATFTYPPNLVAAEILINQIYPRLQQIYSQCRLILVGRNPPKSMKEVAQRDPGILVTGIVPDIRPYLSAASVVIVPLWEGGGTRLKILEAFAAGRPVVSTTKGAEGLRVRDGEHLLIRDTVEELVAGVCQLWSEPSLRKKLADSAYKLVREEYSWEAVGRQVEQAVQELL